MGTYKGPHCYVVTIMEGGYKFYLKSTEEKKAYGYIVPILVGHFVPDLMEAKKFLKEWEAKFFAGRFKDGAVEIIKEGEMLK